MQSLELGSLLSKTHYRLTNDDVEIEHRKLWSRQKQSVPLDSIQHRSRITSVSSRPLFWVTVAFILLAVAVFVSLAVDGDGEATAPLFYGVFALGFGALYLKSRKTYEIFPGFQYNLYFALSQSREPDVRAFMDALSVAKQRAIVGRAIMRFETIGTEDALAYLKMLRENEIVTDGEFARLKGELDQHISSAQRGEIN